jgi:osmotically inducible protein OsmC
MHAESTASTSWEGTLAHGSGTTTLASGAAPPLEVSWGARTERTAGATSPEELIAAAHASCFAMAFSAGLAGEGATPERLDVSVTVAFDTVDGAPTITSSALTVRGRVDGIDAAGFAAAAEAAITGCPVSRALMGNVEVTLDAELL